MFHFATTNRLYHHIGLLLVCVPLSLFVFGLPNFQSGIWIQTEPVMVALFALAALTSAWLCIGVARGWLEMQPMHPLWLAMLLWGGWQLVITSITHAPWQSWFGAPENGEGAGRYACLLLLIATFYPLWQIGLYRRILIAVAVANMLVMTLLQQFTFDAWRPEIWPDYLAFMAGYFWIAVLAGEVAATRRTFTILAIGTAALAVLAQSKAALPLLLFAIALTAWLEVPVLCGMAARLQPRARTRYIAMALCLLPVAWIFFSPVVSSSDSNHHYGARFIFNRIGMSVMQHEPVRWLVGRGWGRLEDDMFRYALADGVHVYRDGVRDVNWDVNAHFFHSHSQPLEVLLALGLPGLVLWFALPLLVLRYVPPDYFWRLAPMVVALVALSFFWFELPVSLPYEALAWAALLTICTGARYDEAQLAPNGLTALFLWGAIGFGWSAWAQYGAIEYGNTWYVTERAGDAQGHTAKEPETDLARGGDRLHESAVNFALFVQQRAAMGLATENDRKWYAIFMQAMKDAADNPKIGAFDSSGQLVMDYTLLAQINDPAFAALRHQATQQVEDAVMQMTKKAPLREDLAAPFLSNLDGYTHGDREWQMALLKHILDIAPDHRTALWLLGKLYLASPDTADEGKKMMRRAVELGVARVYPVTDKEISAAP